MKRTPTQIKRLWQLVDLMKYDPDPENFTMWMYKHDCGAPACLLGHALDSWPELRAPMSVCNFFGLTSDEHWYLFASISLGGKHRLTDTPSIAASRVIDVIEGGS